MPFTCGNETNIANACSSLLNYCNIFTVIDSWCNCIKSEYGNKCGGIEISADADSNSSSPSTDRTLELVLFISLIGLFIIVLGIYACCKAKMKNKNNRNPNPIIMSYVSSRRNSKANNNKVAASDVGNNQFDVVLDIEHNLQLQSYENGLVKH